MRWLLEEPVKDVQVSPRQQAKSSSMEMSGMSKCLAIFLRVVLVHVRPLSMFVRVMVVRPPSKVNRSSVFKSSPNCEAQIDQQYQRCTEPFVSPYIPPGLTEQICLPPMLQ